MHRHAQPTGTLPAGRKGHASVRLITRLARRDIARHRARAVLVILLIALPVAMVSGLCTIWSSDQASIGSAAATEQTFGDADVVVGPIDSWDGKCHQEEHLASTACKEAGTKETPAADLKRQQQALASVRLPGVTLEPVRTASTTVNWRGLQVDAVIVAADQFKLRTTQMTLPKGATAMPGADEIWISAEAAQRYDWGVGRTIRINGADYKVAGISRAGSSPPVQIWVAPGSPLAAGGDLTWFGTGRVPSFAQAVALNRQGLAVMVQRNYAEWGVGGGDNASTVAATFGVGALAALVTATIAGAAFAIGARQQRRTLALLGATGADRRVLRRLVTGQGVLLGCIGAVLGAALGVAYGVGIMFWRNAETTTYPDAIEVSWAMSAGAIVIGVIAATVAAWVPARAVAKQDVLAGVRSAETASRPRAVPVDRAGPGGGRDRHRDVGSGALPASPHTPRAGRTHRSPGDPRRYVPLHPDRRMHRAALRRDRDQPALDPRCGGPALRRRTPVATFRAAGPGPQPGPGSRLRRRLDGRDGAVLSGADDGRRPVPDGSEELRPFPSRTCGDRRCGRLFPAPGEPRDGGKRGEGGRE
ncbi:MAG: FtsX-like permease family protein [Acidipropionibacterium sp.]|jgi:putative ABC transport system permease protein|nr:FtsX-like permease family protein [Acidipropionibacterium sp.]